MSLHCFPLALLCLITSINVPCFAGSAKTNAPVCALIDPDKSPQAALLEARLLSQSKTTWVERDAIDRVLREQSLQAALSPQGIADRVRLGKLLKADLLVFVRTAKNAKEPTLDVVVSDTERGLRLVVRSVAVTTKGEEDVAALFDAVQAGLKKFAARDIRDVVAVPPFGSTNLGYEHEHLKSAYAKLVEQAAFAQPGVVVVELSEAEAIAQELKLTDPGATLKRLPPLYLLGEFRHQGRGSDLQVTLKLHANRNGKPIGDALTKTVTVKEAPAFLHTWTTDRLKTEKAGPAVAQDGRAEAKQLAELSRLRQRVGDWDDAHALLEASLLLNPNQPDLNDEAMAVIKIRLQRMLKPVGTYDIDTLRRLAQLHRRGFEHMEALIVSRAKLPHWEHSIPYDRGGRVFFSLYPFPPRLRPGSPFKQPKYPEGGEELGKELQQERRTLFLNLLPLIAKDGNSAEVNWAMNFITWEMPLAERLDEFSRLVLKYQEFPSVVAVSGRYSQVSINGNTLDEIKLYRKVVERFLKEGNADVRSAAEKSLKHLDLTEREIIRIADQKKIAIKSPATPPPSNFALLTPEQQAAWYDKFFADTPLKPIRLEGGAEVKEMLPFLRGVTAAGPGVDVFWGTPPFVTSKDKPDQLQPGGPVLLIMKEKGKLRKIWSKSSFAERFTTVCFDGRYIWAATEAVQKAPALYVLDPQTETVAEVTAEHGLPQPTEEIIKKQRNGEQALSLRLVPLDAGRVCVAGGFGRGWVGIASFDARSGKPAVKVIHEAREVSNQNDKEVWANPKIAFMPMAMYVVGDAKTGRRVLVIRSTSHFTGTGDIVELPSHPLVIDPDKLEISVIKEGHLYRNWIALPDGTGRVVEWSPRTYTLQVLYVDRAANVSSMAKVAIPNPSVSFFAERVGNRICIAMTNRAMSVQPGGSRMYGSSWWTADLDGRNGRKEAEDMPPVEALMHSSHYGLVALFQQVPGLQFCEVRFTK